MRSRFIRFVFFFFYIDSAYFILFYFISSSYFLLNGQNKRIIFFAFFDFNFAISASDFMNLWRLLKYAFKERWEEEKEKTKIALHKSSFFFILCCLATHAIQKSIMFKRLNLMETNVNQLLQKKFTLMFFTCV